MFVSSGDRDLGVAFQTHPGSPALFLGEAKYSAFLSSHDGYLLSALGSLSESSLPWSLERRLGIALQAMQLMMALISR